MKPILIDMDGVVADFVDAYYEMATLPKYNALADVLPEFTFNIDRFYIDECIAPENRTDEVTRLANEIVNEEGLFLQMNPIRGAVDGVKRLKEKSGRDIFFVSAPHKSNKHSYSEKAIWIERHFGEEWLDRLILTRDKTVVSGCVLIDDKPNPMGKFSPDWTHIVFDQPYNQTDVATKGKRRMFSWKDIDVDSLVHYLKGKE